MRPRPLPRALRLAALTACLTTCLTAGLTASGCKGEGGDGIHADTPPATIWKNTCSRCHGFGGEGTSRLGKAVDMREAGWQATRSDAEIAGTIRKGKRNDRGGVMESYEGRLSDAQIQGLVQHIRAFGPQPKPAPAPAPAPSPAPTAPPAP